MDPPKRILIVDDHPLVREGLKAIFSDQPDFVVAGAASSVSEALNLVDDLLPDLVISDMSLTDRSGLELIKDLKSLHPGIPVLVVSMHDERVYAERVLKAGGRGYLMKDTPAEQIVEAALTVLGGGVYVSRETNNRFLEAMAEGPAASRFSLPIQRLTDREIEIFELLGLAKNSHEIAKQLNISSRTVDAHRTQIRRKLQISDGHALVAYAIQWAQSGATR